MKSEDALKSLTTEQQEWLQTHSKMYHHYISTNNKEMAKEESICIYSFLTGLEFAKAISNRDKMLLHIYATK